MRATASAHSSAVLADVQALELLVHVELFGDFALLLGDERGGRYSPALRSPGPRELGLRAAPALERGRRRR